MLRKQELYSGPYAANAPDLLVNFWPGFRVSWQSAVGACANALMEDNTRRWSGDHIIDPDAVPGILLMNQNPPTVSRKKETRTGHPGSSTELDGAPPLSRSSRPDENTPSIIDLAPTILNYLGVPVPEIMEGIPLL